MKPKALELARREEISEDMVRSLQEVGLYKHEALKVVRDMRLEVWRQSLIEFAPKVLEIARRSYGITERIMLSLEREIDTIERLPVATRLRVLETMHSMNKQLGQVMLQPYEPSREPPRVSVAFNMGNVLAAYHAAHQMPPPEAMKVQEIIEPSPSEEPA